MPTVNASSHVEDGSAAPVLAHRVVQRACVAQMPPGFSATTVKAMPPKC